MQLDETSYVPDPTVTRLAWSAHLGLTYAPIAGDAAAGIVPLSSRAVMKMTVENLRGESAQTSKYIGVAPAGVAGGNAAAVKLGFSCDTTSIARSDFQRLIEQAIWSFGWLCLLLFLFSIVQTVCLRKLTHMESSLSERRHVEVARHVEKSRRLGLQLPQERTDAEILAMGELDASDVEDEVHSSRRFESASRAQTRGEPLEAAVRLSSGEREGLTAEFARHDHEPTQV